MSEPSRATCGQIAAISTSSRKGVRKQNTPEVDLIEGFGIRGDAHAGPWHRQVSLLAMESIEKIRARGLDVGPGDFAENITTRGIDVPGFRVGDRILVGDCELEVTQIGKVCHSRCAIYYQAGDCVMPREGVFARVLKGGTIRVDDRVQLSDSPTARSGPAAAPGGSRAS